ncbi:Hypothetical Protein FCC1311_113192, partial [Hondaea fermentalgiana]
HESFKVVAVVEDKTLGLDTSFSQRRNAAYAFSLFGKKLRDLLIEYLVKSGAAKDDIMNARSLVTHVENALLDAATYNDGSYASIYEMWHALEDDLRSSKNYSLELRKKAVHWLFYGFGKRKGAYIPEHVLFKFMVAECNTSVNEAINAAIHMNLPKQRFMAATYCSRVHYELMMKNTRAIRAWGVFKPDFTGLVSPDVFAKWLQSGSRRSEAEQARLQNIYVCFSSIEAKDWPPTSELQQSL